MHVHNNNSYGFTLNLDTDQPDLVNSEDSTYRINSVTGYYKYLAANQWGYGMGSDATSFNPVSNATLTNVTKDNSGDCYSTSDCTIKLTFGANIDLKRLPVGNYSTMLTYTATSKPAPDWGSVCRDRYPGSDAETSGKRSYCIQHQGSMSGYQPDWVAICRERYPGSEGELLDQRAYCVDHHGEMSGYQANWSGICSKRYPYTGMESFDKEQYCTQHQGDMSGYQTNWDAVCSDRYDGSGDDSFEKIEYCINHQGDMSGYQYDSTPHICSAKYHGTDPISMSKFNYCMNHHGDMSGYNPYPYYPGPSYPYPGY